ncbi:acyltransferase family protein [Altericroceibacterium xinjiangense]|uniref:acyltransferase family protein n=1 Tax=Altericroceibacterium xinjiangense TaxID=762261 RepID=UPI0013E0551E|nr:acyltransferase [Altericroceibacterium xinjiangense]
MKRSLSRLPGKIRRIGKVIFRSSPDPALVAREPDSGRFVALDSLRGIAALMVVGFHMEFGGALIQSAFIRNGWLAVDFFFILSGFVIAGAYGQKLQAGFSIRHYALLRLGRIYPLHFALLILMFAAQVAFLLLQRVGLLDHPAFDETHPLPSFFLQLLLLHGFLEPNPFDWNFPSWSISIEIWLYLAMALVWARAGTKAWLIALACAIGSLALLVSGLDVWATPISIGLMRGVAGFGLGIAAWQVWSRYLAGRAARLSRGAASLAECAILAAIVALLQLMSDSVNPAMADPLFFLAILIFAAERGVISRVLRTTPMIWLGVLSFSIYLVHVEVVNRAIDVLALVGVLTLVQRDGVDVWQVAGPSVLADLPALAVMALTVPAAWLTWRFIESPARDWSRRKAKSMGAGRAEAVAPTM